MVEGLLDKKIAHDLMGASLRNYHTLFSATLRDSDLKEHLKCFQNLNEIFKKMETEDSTVETKNT